MDLRSISDNVLLENMESTAGREREITLQALQLLREVDRRSLYLKLSYKNLFEYAVGKLKYSEGSAQRRISSMRLLKELPELEKKFESGALPLSTLSQAQSFFNQEKTENSEKREILETLENKSVREVQRELVSRSSEPEKLYKEKIRAVSATHTEVKFLVKEEFLAEIEELRAILSHQMPGATVKEVLGFAVKKTLKVLRIKEPKKDLKLNGETKKEIDLVKTVKGTKKIINEKSPPALAVKSSRYIPVEVKRRVWKRDGGQCSFECNGRNCTSKHYLEFDHIVPFALGGQATVENLRVRCRAHNQLAAVAAFGVKKMEQYVPRIR
jgi:hypothetical protein